MTTPRANWNYPTRVRFGAGRVSEAGDAVKTLGMKRPLLVTDSGLASHPIIESVQASLRDAGYAPAVYSDVRPNPTEKHLATGVAAFRAGGHDGVVAVGGGSALDLGKLVAFMAHQTRPVWDFEDVDDWWTRADAARIAPIVALPTTAGTGSEVGRSGVITDSGTHTKKVIFHPQIMPGIVICDPELTTGMPQVVTAGTGFDAFAHCLEAYCADGYHPMADGIALEGMRLVLAWLPQAYRAPDDLEARSHMMSAALMGATAFQKGLGGVHALSHPIGAQYDTHHGMTNAVVTPAVLTVNRPAIEQRIERAAAYLGVAGGFNGFFDRVLALRADIGVPATLVALGVPRSGFDKIVTASLSDPTAGGNPLPFNQERAEQMLALAFGD